MSFVVSSSPLRFVLALILGPPNRSPSQYEPPAEINVTKEDRDIAKMKDRLEGNNSTSLDEAKSRQRRAVEQRASMSIKLKLPDESQPLLRAAAKGDVAALERAARAFTRGGEGEDYEILSNVGNTSGVAALRADARKITALHFAAFFHQSKAARKLLALAVEPIKQGAQLEIDSLLQKRQRFLEEARYAYRQALSNVEDDTRRGNNANVEAIKEDAEAFANWCGEEIARILRAR